jgi:UDP-glucose 4-epimerase
MNVLVTGGAGFIASNLVDSLLALGYRVIVVDNFSTGNPSHVSPLVKFYQMDIIDERLDQVFLETQPEIVFHYAAQIDVQTSMKDPGLDATSNILGTINVLQCCKKYKARKLIYASTAAIYGLPNYLPLTEDYPANPISFYGLSKLAPEKYIELFSKQHGLEYTILRYSNAYGIRQSANGEGGVISIFLSRLLNAEAAIIHGDGEHTRDFVYVKDIVSANLKAISLGANQTYNISCNQQTSLNQLLKLMCKLTGRPFNPVNYPARDGDIVHSRLDNTKAYKELGWQPHFTLERGLKEMIDYYTGSIAD